MSLPAGTILTRRFVVQIGTVPSGTLIINDDYGVTSFEGVRDNGKPVTTLVHNKPTIEISLFPTDSEIESSPGQTVAYTFQVINSGILSDSYRLMASGLWTITVSPTQTNKLLPEASEQVTVTVTIPSTMTQTTTNATTVTVTSAGSGASITRLLRTTATIVTSTNRKIYLPLVKNN
jgi:uncharacterized membrane protein